MQNGGRNMQQNSEDQRGVVSWLNTTIDFGGNNTSLATLIVILILFTLATGTTFLTGLFSGVGIQILGTLVAVGVAWKWRNLGISASITRIGVFIIVFRVVLFFFFDYLPDTILSRDTSKWDQVAGQVEAQKPFGDPKLDDGSILGDIFSNDPRAGSAPQAYDFEDPSTWGVEGQSNVTSSTTTSSNSYNPQAQSSVDGHGVPVEGDEYNPNDYIGEDGGGVAVPEIFLDDNGQEIFAEDPNATDEQQGGDASELGPYVQSELEQFADGAQPAPIDRRPQELLNAIYRMNAAVENFDRAGAQTAAQAVLELDANNGAALDLMERLDAIRAVRAVKLSMPVSGEWSVNQLDADTVRTALVGGEYTIVRAPAFTLAACQDVATIQETQGWLKGEQYQVRLCLLDQFNGVGKRGDVFRVPAQ
jgi:hypothetical protein